MRIATDEDIAATVAQHRGRELPLPNYRDEMLSHPIAGPCLRNYGLLTEYPDVCGRLGLSADERFWSRNYWLSRFAREWQAAAGYDAGLEQQLFQLLESADHNGIAYEPLPEVEAAVERDAVVRPLG